MNSVKVGIIGCGWFGNFHLNNLLKMEDVEVTALVSTNSEKLQETAKKLPQARLYKDYHDLFDNEKLDAVFICVPPNSHGDIELLAAAHGIHIYVEKPIEISMERAEMIEKAICDAGILSSCGYHERYNTAVNEAKSYVASREIGLVAGQWLGGMPGVKWWRRKEGSGGQIVEQTTHIFDMLRYFFGEVQTVYCKAVTGLITDVPDYNIEDASIAVVNFENGIVANIQTGCYFNDKVDGKIGMQIYCRDCIVEYDWMKEIRYITKEKSEKVPAEFTSHFYAAQAFIQAVKTNDASLIRSPYSDAIKTLALTLAANDSIKSGLPIAITARL